MRVHLNFKPKTSFLHRTTAAGIVSRDHNANKHRRLNPTPAVRVRNIDLDEISSQAEEMVVYKVGHRDVPFVAPAYRQSELHKLFGFDRKVIHKWLKGGKLPQAILLVVTGSKGYPPKAYSKEEVIAIATCLKTHYVEKSHFLSNHTGLINSIRIAVKRVRDRDQNLN